LDLDTKYKNNHEFFDELYKKTMNNEVGLAFWLYLKKIDISKYNSQVFKETKAKKAAKADRLHTIYKFIKFNYILREEDLECTVKELFKDYQDYLELIESQAKVKKRQMCSVLREAGIDYKCNNSKSTYKYNVEQLCAIAEKFKWYSEDDAEEFEDNNLFKTYKNVSNSSRKDKEIERLKNKIADLEKQLEKKNEVKKITTKKPKNEVKKITTKKPKNVKKVVKKEKFYDVMSMSVFT
jgi:hypothetical protein